MSMSNVSIMKRKWLSGTSESKSLGLAVATVIAGIMIAQIAIAAPTAIYWTDRDNATLNRHDLSTNIVLVPPTGGRLQDVDLDPATGTLFFSDWGTLFVGGGGSINQVNTDGTGLATVLSTGDAVHQLALDPANSRIFFTRAVSYDGREISVVNMDGTGYAVLHFPDWFPSGLALDSANNKLYWGDIGVLNFGTPRGAVNVMNTDGTFPTQLQPHVNGRGRGFALHNGIIYLTAHNPLSPGSGGGIFTYDIASNILNQIITDPNTGFWDIEVDPIEQRIYFTNYGAGTIESANFDGSDRVTVLDNLSNPYGLALEFEDFRRMTGGGSVFTSDGMRVTHGFELHCDASLPNNLQVNWPGNRFHLTQLNSAFCSDAVAISEGQPVAGFDTFVGSGVGRLNGLDGATIQFTLTDAGEPGKGVDVAEFSINGGGALLVSGSLKNGNHQAHPQ